MNDEHSRIALNQDTALQEKLMSLLIINETKATKLFDSKFRKDPAQALRIICDLVNSIAGFAESTLNINRDYLQKSLVNESKNYSNVRLLHLNRSKLSVETVINLFKGWASHPSDRQPIFEEIYNSLFNIIKSYFVLFESSFSSDLMKKQWSELYTVNLEELKSIMRSIKF